MKEKVFFNNETIKLMSLFEKVTRSKVKDCFEDKNGLLTFLVPSGELKKAVGKNASNVKKIESMLNRRIKIVEFHDDITRFIKSLIFPFKVSDIVLEDSGIVTVHAEDHKTRGLIIGRNASNLRNYESIVQKYFPLKELRVA